MLSWTWVPIQDNMEMTFAARRTLVVLFLSSRCLHHFQNSNATHQMIHYGIAGSVLLVSLTALFP